MPDNNNDLLGETPEVWTGNEEKKGAPVLDMSDLDGLLGDTPAVWDGGETKKGAPVLEEQVQLDAPAQSWVDERRGAPVLDEAPQLDDGTYQAAAPANNGPVLDANVDDILGGGEPAAYDEVAEFCQRLQFDEALKEKFVTLTAEQQTQVVAMRAQQLGLPAPMIPNALRPKVAEELPEEADVQLEEAPQQEEYVPQFKDEDLERIKEESKKPQRYVPPQVEMTEEQKKESRRMMNELREEREREMAKKGFVQLIILSVVGVVAAAAFALFFSGAFGLGYKEEAAMSWLGTVKSIAPVLGVVMAVSALVLAAPVPQLKGITKLLFTLGFILSLVPGIPLLIQKEEGHGLVNGLLFAVMLLGTLSVVVTMSISDSINKYNKYGLQ
ncbi:MAG: hypothetical protein IKI21_03575 [Oscillospiraceae bacterium]|nr:hypothetical protein [Oscillospiraceae bacterium]